MGVKSLVSLTRCQTSGGNCLRQSGIAATQHCQSRGRHERTGDDVQSSWYGSRGATWEVNPRRSYHDFDEERRTDPEGVQTRIDCNPPYSKTGFYRSYPDKVRKSFCYPERAAILGYEVVPISHNVQVDGVLEHRTFTGVRLLWAESDDEDRVLGGDLGERSDIFALAIARAEACNRSIDVQRVLRRERIVEGLPGFGERVQERTVHRNVNVRTVDRAVVIDGLIEIVL
jgi:hypothetical protein